MQSDLFMKRISKQASAQVPTEWLIGTIILIAGFLLVFPVTTLFAEDSTGAIKDSVCTGFITARSQFEGINIGNWKLVDVPIPCRKKVISITGDRDAVKQQLSKYMAQCWVIFGQGRLTQSLDLRTSFGIPGGSKVADSLFPCYEVTIDSLRGDDPISAQELYQFMKSTRMSQESSDETTNYFDFITKDNGIGGRLALLEPQIQEGTTYSIYFSDPSEELFPDEWGKLNGIYLKEKGKPITIEEGFGLGNMQRLGGALETEPGRKAAVNLGISGGIFAVGITLTATGIGAPVGGALMWAAGIVAAGTGTMGAINTAEFLQQEAFIFDAASEEVD